MTSRHTRIGSLDCTIVGPHFAEQPPKLVTIICHGFGAPGTDLVPVAYELVRAQPQLADTTQFIMPSAPIALDDVGIPGGRAWWWIDIAELNRKIAAGEFRDLRNDVPEGLEAARDALVELIATVREETGLCMSQIALAGFSQGAMLCLETLMSLDESPGALCVWSGTLLNESHWRERAPRHASLPLFQSHGFQDPILPHQAALWLRDLLQESGLNVDFLEFPGMHTIPQAAIDESARLLAETLYKNSHP